ncbi:MAG TPA: FHA domain-containing protein, partial [Nannocystis sp.]
MPHLQYTGPDGVTHRFPLRHRITQIGSSRECHLVLPGPEVAASHCTLEHEAGCFKVESSSRSTVFFVGGKKMREHVLRHGDVFVVGGVEITFSAIDPPPPAADPESAARLQIEAMRNLQRFSELLARAESSLDGLLSELIDQVVALTGASKGFLVLTEGDRYVI